MEGVALTPIHFIPRQARQNLVVIPDQRERLRLFGIKKIRGLRFCLLLALGCLLGALPVSAQFTNMNLGVSYRTNAIAVGSSLTYTMFITNLTSTSLQGAFLTNTITGGASITGVAQNLGTNSQTGNTVVFNTGPIPPFLLGGVPPQFTVTATASSTGFFTNAVTLFDPTLPAVVSTTNLVNLATNFVLRSDLAVSLFGPTATVYSNDWTSYRVSVTNLGPSAVTNVMLTNHMPTTVGVISITPSPTFSGPAGALIFNLGTLTNGAAKNFTFLIQPTNSGVLAFSAAVGAANLVDTNTANNSAAISVSVLDFSSAQLSVTNVSAMTNNLQTGLLNQLVRLSNLGTNDISSARIALTGLAKLAPGSSTVLYNAVGTNNGKPFVVYGQALTAGQHADLILEYYSQTSHQPFPVQNSNYFAVAIGPVNLSSTGGTNGSLSITNIAILPNGDVLLGFKAIPGRTYTVIYGDTPASTPLAAQPSFVAPANIVQWIDDGPPKTISPPSTAPARFYRVRLEP